VVVVWGSEERGHVVWRRRGVEVVVVGGGRQAVGGRAALDVRPVRRQGKQGSDDLVWDAVERLRQASSVDQQPLQLAALRDEGGRERRERRGRDEGERRERGGDRGSW